MLSIFCNDKSSPDKFDLLMLFRRFVGRVEFAATFRTGFECEFDGLVDLFGLKRFSQMSLVSFLSANFPFPFAFRFWFGRLNDVGGGRFGRVAGVLCELGDL